MIILQAIRVIGLSITGFLIAFLLTPLISKLLYRFHAAKQIRTTESAPVFSSLHAKKAGTPTMGGVIIWVTVIGLAFFFLLMAWSFKNRAVWRRIENEPKNSCVSFVRRGGGALVLLPAGMGRFGGTVSRQYTNWLAPHTAFHVYPSCP